MAQGSGTGKVRGKADADERVNLGQKDIIHQDRR